MPGRDRPQIDASFDLDDLGLDPSSRIVVEAYAKDLAEQFAWGTVARPSPERSPSLSELPPARVSFRVKVVDPTSHRLLALARRLRPIGENDDNAGRHELFRVRAAPLGQELWRVVLDDDGAPTLEVNKDKSDVLREPHFCAAILPAAMRTALLHLRDDDQDQDDDPNSWSQRWLRFAAALAGGERPGADDPDEVRKWIDRACSRFAEHFGFMSAIVAADEQRSES